MLAGAGLLGISLTVPAFADPPQYMLFDLGSLNTGEEYDEEVIVFGMNNHGECVGVVKPFSGPFQAFVWLPAAAYGEAKGIYSLDVWTSMTPISGSQIDEGTAAFDINDAGIAVGSFHEDTIPTPTSNALVWTLSTDGRYALTDRFTAFSINNDTTPLITGGSGRWYEYNDLILDYNKGAGFYHIYNGSTTDLAVSGTRVSTGHGIANTISSSAAIAGLMSCDIDFPLLCTGTICEDFNDGAWWSNVSSTAAEMEEVDVDGSHTMAILGHAVSNDGYVVGFGRDPDTQSTNPCRQLPLYWSNPTSSVTELPMFDDDPEETELALDIRDAQSGMIEVVGRNATSLLALRWRYEDSTWSVLNLNDAGVVHSMGNFNQLISANAINDDGWIAGYGEQGDGIESPIVDRSFVLIPYDVYPEFCPQDLTGGDMGEEDGPDGAVDVHDLFLLLANWDTDGAGAGLVAPYDVVNTSDLFNLLARFGGCVPLPADPPTLEDQLNDAEVDTEDWVAYQAVMTDPESTSQEKANYKCWMQNYLSGCTSCPECPDVDPYD